MSLFNIIKINKKKSLESNLHKIKCDYCGQLFFPSEISLCPYCNKNFCQSCLSLHKCTLKNTTDIKLANPFATSKDCNQEINDLKNRIKILEKALCQKDNEINTLKNELDRLKNNYR